MPAGLTATAGLPKYHTIFGPGFFVSGHGNSMKNSQGDVAAIKIARWTLFYINSKFVIFD